MEDVKYTIEIKIIMDVKIIHLKETSTLTIIITKLWKSKKRLNVKI